jgi:DNA-binding transcriptional LysR family regulator
MPLAQTGLRRIIRKSDASLGCLPTFCGWVFTPSETGAVDVELYSMNVPDQVAALRQGRIDAGFLRPPVTDPTLDSEFLLSEPFVVAMPKNHRLAKHKRVPIVALKDEPIIMGPRATLPFFFDLMLRLFHDSGFVTNVHHEVDYPTMVLGLVGSGLGISLVPAGVPSI